jgi:hypothetical protein
VFAGGKFTQAVAKKDTVVASNAKCSFSLLKVKDPKTEIVKVDVTYEDMFKGMSGCAGTTNVGHEALIGSTFAAAGSF